MSINKLRLRNQLMRHEGVRTMPYIDTEGYLTIGVGRNLDSKGLSDSEVQFLLNNDIDEALMECRRVIPGFHELNGVRQQVLVNMCFNLGLPRLMGFKKMFAAIAEQDWQAAADEMLDSRWALQVGDRAVELSLMMKTGLQLD